MTNNLRADFSKCNPLGNNETQLSTYLKNNPNNVLYVKDISDYTPPGSTSTQPKYYTGSGATTQYVSSVIGQKALNSTGNTIDEFNQTVGFDKAPEYMNIQAQPRAPGTEYGNPFWCMTCNEKKFTGLHTTDPSKSAICGIPIPGCPELGGISNVSNTGANTTTWQLLWDKAPLSDFRKDAYWDEQGGVDCKARWGGQCDLGYSWNGRYVWSRPCSDVPDSGGLIGGYETVNIPHKDVCIAKYNNKVYNNPTSAPLYANGVVAENARCIYPFDTIQSNADLEKLNTLMANEQFPKDLGDKLYNNYCFRNNAEYITDPQCTNWCKNHVGSSSSTGDKCILQDWQRGYCKGKNVMNLGDSDMYICSTYCEDNPNFCHDRRKEYCQAKYYALRQAYDDANTTMNSISSTNTQPSGFFGTLRSFLGLDALSPVEQAKLDLETFLNDDQCGCYLPDSVYQEYADALKKKIGTTSVLISNYIDNNSKCMYPSCATAKTTYKDGLECPSVVLCSQNVSITLGENASIEADSADINQSQECSSEINEKITSQCEYGTWGDWSACENDIMKRTRTLLAGQSEVCTAMTETLACTSSDPVTSDPITSDPVTSDPVTSDPVTSDPITSDPITSDPITSDPVTSDPITSDPVTSDPITSDPVTSDPVTSDPVTSDPVTSDPTPEEKAVAERTEEEKEEEEKAVAAAAEQMAKTNKLLMYIGIGFGAFMLLLIFIGFIISIVSDSNESKAS